jgi:hypothetical protein
MKLKAWLSRVRRTVLRLLELIVKGAGHGPDGRNDDWLWDYPGFIG